MREIEFRAWDKGKNEMFYPDKFDETMVLQLNGVVGLFNGKTYDTVTDRFVIEQFTGLKDKNGVKTYEGDIIEYHSYEYNEDVRERYIERWTAPVVFKDMRFKLDSNYISDEFECMEDGNIMWAGLPHGSVDEIRRYLFGDDWEKTFTQEEVEKDMFGTVIDESVIGIKVIGNIHENPELLKEKQ